MKHAAYLIAVGERAAHASSSHIAFAGAALAPACFRRVDLHRRRANGNTTAPANDPGFSNVVSTWVRTGSAVYLGDGWMLTDNHVGAGRTMVQGVFYDLVPGSAHQSTNPPGATFTPMSDVHLVSDQWRVRICPRLSIGESAPQSGDIGSHDRQWARSESVGANTGLPSWSPSTTPSAYTGFTWATTNHVRWGTNKVDGVGFPQGSGNKLEVLQHEFLCPAQNATPYEAIGTAGDSGGGVFSYNNSAGSWELIGLMDAYTKFCGQPVNVSVFGNLTYAIQLSAYRNQILSYLTPGDVTGDGTSISRTSPGGHQLVKKRRRRRQS